MFSIITKGTGNKSANITQSLNKSMVLQNFEYCIHYWSLHLKKSILELEKGDQHYQVAVGRLQHLPFFSLEERCVRGDMRRDICNYAWSEKKLIEQPFSLSHSLTQNNLTQS